MDNKELSTLCKERLREQMELLAEESKNAAQLRHVDDLCNLTSSMVSLVVHLLSLPD